jgi:hypothetical protein
MSTNANPPTTREDVRQGCAFAHAETLQMLRALNGARFDALDKGARAEVRETLETCARILREATEVLTGR